MYRRQFRTARSIQWLDGDSDCFVAELPGADILRALALLPAGVVELVDTTDSKSVAFKSVPVQVRPPVPHHFIGL